MKVSIVITEKRTTRVYGTFQPDKTETAVVAEIKDAEMERDALVGILRALADSLEPETMQP